MRKIIVITTIITCYNINATNNINTNKYYNINNNSTITILL